MTLLAIAAFWIGAAVLLAAPTGWWLARCSRVADPDDETTRPDSRRGR